MNAANTRIARICNPASLLDMLISGKAFPAQTEIASTGPTCSGTGETPSAYLAPRQTHWLVNYAGEDFETGRTYFRRCR